MVHARVGIFNSLKPLLKTKPKNKEMVTLSLHHTTYVLFSILAYFLTTQLNHLQCVFNCIIKNIPISQNLLLLKIANLVLLSVFYFSKFTLSLSLSLSEGILRKILVQVFISTFLPLKFKWAYTS